MKDHVKRIICAVVTLCLLFSLMACGGSGNDDVANNPDEPPASTGNTVSSAEVENITLTESDAEIQKAINLGLVPDVLQRDYDQQITYAEFCAVLESFINSQYSEYLSAWQETSAKFSSADELMSRMEGMIIFFHAAECVGLDAAGYEYNIPLEDLIPDGKDFYEGVTWEYPLLPENGDYYNEALESTDYQWRNECDYWDNAKRFAECYSYSTGATYFDYDETYSLNLGNPFTRGDAIRAVERLYETSRFFQYTPRQEVTSTVTKEALALAAKMPGVNYDDLPYWRGYTVANRQWTINEDQTGMKYNEDEIELLAETGFNFVRVPLDFNQIFVGMDTSLVCGAMLEAMDELLGWCAEYGVHVCFDLHDMPGFTTNSDDSDDDLFTNPETQERFEDFWRFLSTYYEDVPSNLLSFNLLNEPHCSGELTDEVYSAVMMKAIEAIREVSPDRFIFADTLGVIAGTPVYGLVDAKVVQAIHPYFLSDYTQQWPIYTINGFLLRDNGVFMLNGEFSEGTKLTLAIDMVHQNSEFTLYVDDTPVDTLALGAEQVGENHCTGIYEQGTDGECRSYEDMCWIITLPKGCSEIRIEQSGGSWYMLDYLTLSASDLSVMVSANGSFVESEAVPKLHIANDGTVVAEDTSTLVALDKVFLRDMFHTYQEFTKETGVPIMVQEFGFNETIAYDATLAAAKDFFSVMDEYGVSWCSWWGNFGLWISRHSFENKDKLRDGAKYEVANDNWMVDTGLMEIYQQHMK